MKIRWRILRYEHFYSDTVYLGVCIGKTCFRIPIPFYYKIVQALARM